MKSGDTGYLKGGTNDRVTWIFVKVNVIHDDGTITFQQFGGFACWILDPKEVKGLFCKKIPKDRT